VAAARSAGVSEASSLAACVTWAGVSGAACAAHVHGGQRRAGERCVLGGAVDEEVEGGQQQHLGRGAHAHAQRQPWAPKLSYRLARLQPHACERAQTGTGAAGRDKGEGREGSVGACREQGGRVIGYLHREVVGGDAGRR
jgi:hypothetical protein